MPCAYHTELTEVREVLFVENRPPTLVASLEKGQILIIKARRSYSVALTESRWVPAGYPTKQTTHEVLTAELGV